MILIYNGRTKTINFNYNSLDLFIYDSNKKFNTNKIKFIYFNNNLLKENQLNLLNNSHKLYCYSKILSKTTDHKLNKLKNNIINNYLIKSFCSAKVIIKIKGLEKNNDIVKINVFPNIYNRFFYPKGTEIISKKLHFGMDNKIGTLYSVYSIDNLKNISKLKTINLKTFNKGFIDVLKINKIFNMELKNKYLPNIQNIIIIKELQNYFTKELFNKYKNNSDENIYDKILEEQKLVINKNIIFNNNLSDIISETCETKIKLIQHYKDCMIEKKDNLYIHRNNVLSSEYKFVLILGTNNSDSYFVEIKGDISCPSTCGRRYDFFKSLDLAKKNEGFIINQYLKNSQIFSELNFLKTRYYKGYKKIENIIDDLEKLNIIEKICSFSSEYLLGK